MVLSSEPNESPEPEIIKSPLFVISKALIAAKCPLNTNFSIFSIKLHTRMLLSDEPENINFPSFDTITVFTDDVWPNNTNSSVFVQMFHILIVLSEDAEMM